MTAISTDPLFPKMTPRVERAVARMQSALAQLRETLQQDIYMEETPLEVQAVMDNAASAMEATLGALRTIMPETYRPLPQSAELPTSKQGPRLNTQIYSAKSRWGRADSSGAAALFQPDGAVGQLNADPARTARVHLPGAGPGARHHPVDRPRDDSRTRPPVQIVRLAYSLLGRREDLRVR